MRSLASAVLIVVLLLAGLPLSVRAQTTEADVYVAQAVLDFEDRRYADAIANLTKALELEPDHVEALYYMGVAHMAQQQSAAAVPYLEKARAKAPSNLAVAFQLGLAYFALQQYDKAQPLLEEVYRADPTQDGLGYYVGFMRYRQKDYRGALQAFRAGRTADPQLQQLTRFYTGLALAVLGLPGQATAEVERALRLAPGSALTGPAERLRDTIVSAQRERERRLSAELRTGLFYDDNVPVVPNTSLREPLVPELRHHKHESLGELVGARADYAWLRTDQWESTVGYSFFATFNNDLPKFNITDHMVNLGLSRRLAVRDMPAQLAAQYSFDVLFLDERQFLARHTATLSAALVESERYLTQAFGRYQRKDFSVTGPEPPREELRDADNFMVGFVHIFRFAEDRHFIKVGYQWDFDDTTGSDYRYFGNRFQVGGQYTVPWHGLRLKYDFDAHLRDYTDKNVVLPTTNPGSKRRIDAELTHTVRAELPLRDFLGRVPDVMRNFTIAAEYQATMVNSNIDVFAYDRNVASLILSWTY